MVRQLAERFARRVRQEAGSNPVRQIEWIYLTALSRPPNEEEKTLGQSALANLAKEWGRHQVSKDEATSRALTTYCHTMLSSAAFFYID
jgi:hypothetical protein